MLFLTGRFKLNADQIEYRGVLRYAPGDAYIQFKTNETNTSTKARNIYIFVESLQSWAYYTINETLPHHLSRTYIEGENLQQQVYAEDHDEKNSWLPKTMVTNISLKNELLKLEARPAQTQDAPEKSQEDERSIHWQEKCDIADLQHKSTLRAYGLPHFLKTMLFDHVTVILQVLKNESHSEDEYLKGIIAVISDMKYDTTSAHTKNNISDLKDAISIKPIFTHVKAFLARENIDESIGYRSVYDFCILILNEELQSYGQNSVSTKALPHELHHFMIANTQLIDNQLITLLCDIYDELADLKALNFTELDGVISALKQPNDFPQEMANFRAIIRSEYENDHNGASLSSQEIDRVCAERLHELSILHAKKMFEICLNPESKTLTELRLFIMRANGNSNLENYLPDVQEAYAARLAEELIERILDNIEFLQATRALSLPNSYLMHLDDKTVFSTNTELLENFLRNLNPIDRRELRANANMRSLIGTCFVRKELKSDHGFLSIFYIHLANVNENNSLSVNPDFITALCHLSVARIKELFMGATAAHFSAVELLINPIRFSLVEMHDNKENESLEKMDLFEQIINGIFIYRTYSNFERELPRLTLIQINMLIQALGSPDASQAMTFFFSMLGQYSKDEVNTKLKQCAERLEAQRVTLVKKMLDDNNSRDTHKEHAALIACLRHPSDALAKDIHDIPGHISRLEKLSLMAIATLWVYSMSSYIKEGEGDQVIISRALLTTKINPMNGNPFSNIFSENNAEKLMNFLKNLPTKLQNTLTNKRSHVLREIVAQCFINNDLGHLTVHHLSETIYNKLKNDAKQLKFHPIDHIQDPLSIDQQIELIDIYFKACYENLPKDEEMLADMVYNLSEQQWVLYFQHHPEQMHQVKDNYKEDFESTLAPMQKTSMFAERDGAKKMKLFESISKKNLTAMSTETSLPAFSATNVARGSGSNSNANQNHSAFGYNN